MIDIEKILQDLGYDYKEPLVPADWQHSPQNPCASPHCVDCYGPKTGRFMEPYCD